MSMRFTTQWFAAVAVAILAGPLCAQEKQPYEPVYRAWIEAGALFVQSTELRGFPGSAGASKLDPRAGFRAGLGSGSALTPYFSLDWEVGVLASSVKKASGLDDFDATITQVPFLISGTLQYENQTGFTPFVGLGVGAAATAISLDRARQGTTALEGSDYDFVFAWQLAGGLKYAVNPRLGLGVLYKYLWTSDAQWEVENATPSSTGDATLKIDGIRSHAILAFVSYRF
ncbi:MAG TPA: outer membrane beta-barrel protein [Verrucomicrobiae bacterium]|nr:outer membrane beta-barrel protein [Verrucomicrobiae bacterium]